MSAFLSNLEMYYIHYSLYLFKVWSRTNCFKSTSSLYITELHKQQWKTQIITLLFVKGTGLRKTEPEWLSVIDIS